MQPKRYRPAQKTGERKHNILSNISICGETEIENLDYRTTKKLCNTGTAKKSADKKEVVSRVIEKNSKSMLVPSSMPNQNVLIEPANQVIGEDELTGLLLATNGWDDCQMEMLDSLLDSL